MSLPTGTHAADTEYLQRLYDEYCKIVFNNITSQFGDGAWDLRQDMPELIAYTCHQCATAMLNERKK